MSTAKPRVKRAEKKEGDKPKAPRSKAAKAAAADASDAPADAPATELKRSIKRKRSEHKSDFEKATKEELGRRIMKTLPERHRGWNRFVQEESKANPGTAGVAHAEEMSRRWRSLTDDQRASYHAAYEADNAAYKNAIKALSAEERKYLRDYMRFKRDVRRASSKRTESNTAYMRFNVVQHPKIHKEHPELSFGDISRKVAEIWNTLPKEEKAQWAAQESAQE